MKKMKKRKGFTLTELAIVIAVIAILIAVLVPTFISLINKAKESTDSQLAKNMNTLLSTAEIDGKPERMEDVNEILVEGGYTIAKLTPSADGNIFVWNEETNRISYISTEDWSVIYAGDTDTSTFTAANNYWVTVESADEIKAWEDLSYYFGANISGDITFDEDSDSRIDTGTYKLTGTLTYESSTTTKQSDKTSVNSVNTGKAATDTTTSTTAGTATLRGTIANLEINTEKITVTNYSSITTKTTITKTKAYTESGYSVSLEVKANGANVTIANNGYVKALSGTDASKVTNNGYVANASSYSLTNSSSYNISTYTELASFRDKVNNGATFAGVTVELTANINLSGRAWVPIGYDSRDNFETSKGSGTKNTSYKYFAGTFDGNGYTISGLSNDGFTPTTVRKDTYGTGSGENENYLYGLFGIVSGATIKNVKLTNVDIVFDDDLKLDSVGALVGFIEHSAYIYNCSASGSIEATDAVGGLVGRAYDRTTISSSYFSTDGETTANGSALTSSNGYAIVIIGCSVDVTINCSGAKAAGILGYTYTQLNYYIADCTAKGSITMAANGEYCAGIVVTTNGGSGSTDASYRTIKDCTSAMTLTAPSTVEVRKIVYGNNGDTYCITYINGSTASVIALNHSKTENNVTTTYDAERTVTSGSYTYTAITWNAYSAE